MYLDPLGFSETPSSAIAEAWETWLLPFSLGCLVGAGAWEVWWGLIGVICAYIYIYTYIHINRNILYYMHIYIYIYTHIHYILYMYV